MIEFIVALVAFGFVLGLLVTLHELGHFYFAKKAGILCSEFAIGMGPVIYKVKKGETYYSIRALPIGGFVSMAGEDLNENLVQPGMEISIITENNLISEIIMTPKVEGMIKGSVVSRDLYGKDTSDLYIELNINGENTKYNIADECYYVVSQNQKMLLAPYDRCFESKTLLQRFLTIVAGPIMNLVLAFAIFLVVGLATGVPTNDNIIGTVSTNTAKLFLQENDEIIKIGNYEITNWDDIGEAMSVLQDQGAEYIPVIVIREGKEVEVDVKATIQITSVGITNLNVEEYTLDKGIVLGEIASGNKAAEAGLKKDDILLKVIINDVPHEINSWKDIMVLFGNTDEGDAEFVYTRDGVEHTSKKVEIFNKETLESMNAINISYLIGISPTTEFSFFGGIQNGISLTVSNALMIFTTLGQVLNPSAQLGVSDLSGPIGIFAVVQSYLDAGFVPFLSLIGMLSVNLFIVNLLPLPALDGGRLVFLAYEAITKKPVDKKVENIITMAGFVVLMAVMLYVSFNDLLRL